MKTICLARRWLLLAIACISLGGCRGKDTHSPSSITIAVEGDVDTFNPLFSDEVVSAQISEHLFPRLITAEFDTTRGVLHYAPLFATTWQFSPDHRDITFRLRHDVFWSDGIRVTAADVQFSFELYADSLVASVRQSVTRNLRQTNGRMDIARSIEVLDDSTVVFHFDKGSVDNLFDVAVPILPRHVLASIPRSQLRHHAFNTSPVTSGPYFLERYIPLQEVVLRARVEGWCGIIPRIQRLVFKILPEYRTRVAQLISGEVDMVTGLRIEDANTLARQSHVTVVSISGRDYDFIGWNNIDPQVYRNSNGTVIKPHPLFGSKNVRRALTLGIDRERIVRGYLGRHGSVAVTGVSPLFPWAYNDTLRPLPYDPKAARALLAAEGWRDADGDGVLEKDGRKFSFVLKLASGNQLRSVLAPIIQQYLRDLSIEVTIEQVERTTFWNDLLQRRYDAWIAGFRMPLQMQLDVWWHSNLQRSPFNLVGFRNRRVDEILAAVSMLPRETDGAGLWKEFQVIVHEEQPYTFLFWINDLIAINTRIQNAHIGILDPLHRVWEWHADGT